MPKCVRVCVGVWLAEARSMPHTHTYTLSTRRAMKPPQQASEAEVFGGWALVGVSFCLKQY